MRTIAIGDVHGCSQALSILLNRVCPTASDTFVFLGDYVDRGPDTRGVIEQVLKLREICGVITLLGNHESMLLGALHGGDVTAFWIGQCGGRETIASYGGQLDDIPAAHVDFLRGCQRFHETDTHLFVHANYRHDEPLDQQPDEMLLWQHLSWSIPRPHQSGKPVIVGHTPQRSGRILDLGYLKCIDTACFAGGWLTALDVASGHCWQANSWGEWRELESSSLPSESPSNEPLVE